MADKFSRWNHPRWQLVLIVPLLLLVITEDDAITRGLMASSLTLTAILYGRDSKK